MSGPHCPADGPSGRVNTNAAAAHSTAACTRSNLPTTPIAALNDKVAAMTTTATILARRLMAPCARQSVIGGPRCGCVTSQSWRRGDDRAKANAASKRNGVVGTSGRSTPAMPHAVERKPRMSHRMRVGIILRDRFVSCGVDIISRGSSLSHTAIATPPPWTGDRGIGTHPDLPRLTRLPRSHP